MCDKTEGEVNADEFASIIYHFVMNEVNRYACTNIIIYSDGCIIKIVIPPWQMPYLLLLRTQE